MFFAPLSRPQNAPGSHKTAPRCPKATPRCPKSSEKRPKRGPRCPKTAPRTTKKSQEHPKSDPRAAKTNPRGAKIDFTSFFRRKTASGSLNINPPAPGSFAMASPPSPRPPPLLYYISSGSPIQRPSLKSASRHPPTPEACVRGTWRTRVHFNPMLRASG